MRRAQGTYEGSSKLARASGKRRKTDFRQIGQKKKQSLGVRMSVDGKQGPEQKFCSFVAFFVHCGKM
jgi:hypothetical protein